MSVLTIPAATGGGGGLDISPNPTVDDVEFTTALSGWTSLGSPDVVDANAAGYESLLRLSKASPGTFQVYGTYKAAPAIPFTVTARLTDYFNYGNYQQHALMLASASPGALFLWGPTFQSSNGVPEMIAGNWNSRTSRSGTITEYTGTRTGLPKYLRLVVNSNTSVDLWYSTDGDVWINQANGWNPGMTIANVGFGISGNDVNIACSMTVDWMRFGTGAVIQPHPQRTA